MNKHPLLAGIVSNAPAMRRWIVFSKSRVVPLCVCMAINAKHALKIAKANGLRLTRDAIARPE
jgi:hypothetical protein